MRAEKGRNMTMQHHEQKDFWQPGLYESTQSYQFDYGRDLIDDLLKPRAGERILDLGCGTGQITSTIAARGAHVTGIDASPKMVAAAREHHPDIEFLVADGSDFSFPEPFDAVFSTAALHWILEPEKAVRCIAGALRPGGRFAAQFTGRGSADAVFNAAAMVWKEKKGEALKPALYRPSLSEYATLLEQCGFEVVYAALFDHLTRLDGGEEGFARWMDTFGQALFPGALEEERRELYLLVQQQVKETLWKEGYWHIDYRRLRVLAFRRDARPM